MIRVLIWIDPFMILIIRWLDLGQMYLMQQTYTNLFVHTSIMAIMKLHIDQFILTVDLASSA